MAYFPHAFQQIFIGTGGFDSASAGSKPNALTALEMGIVDNTTNNLLSVAATPSYLANPVVYLAQGTSRTSDTHGMHGGYMETAKSKGINPKYVSDFYVVAPVTPQQQIVCIGCESAHSFVCDTTWRLRVDIKGSPALRTFNHQMFKTFDAYTGCCGTDPTDIIDPSVVFEQWKDAINADANFSPFVTASVSYWIKISDVWTDVGSSAPSGDEVCSVTVDTPGSYSGGTTPTWTQSVSVGTGTTFQTHMEALTATAAAEGSGYVPGDILEVVGGTSTNKATYTVTTTAVATATLEDPGAGYNVADVITITTGTGTGATITVDTVDGAGQILTFTLTTDGSYTVNPTLSGAPTTVAPAGGVNATFALTMGAETFTVVSADRGDYTVTPASPAATTAVTGSGTGVTLTALWRIKSVEVLTQGTGHDVAPTLTVSSGAGAATAVLCPDWDAQADADRTNKLCLTAGYVDTVFGTCSFELNDHYEQEPIRIYASVVQDDGTPCDDETFCVEETQPAIIGNGHGERILRELALYNSYRQDYYQHNPRLREVMDETILTDVTRATRYYCYFILHSVPRKYNSDSIHNNDQYLIKIVTSARSAQFETWMNTYLTSAGNHVQLRVQL